MGINLVKIDCEFDANCISCELPPRCPPCTWYPLKKWWVRCINYMSGRKRSYCFTLNNYSLSDIDRLDSIDCSYLVYGKEVAPSGTLHLQGFISWPNAKSFSAAKNLIGRTAHIEVKRGSFVEASTYCKKDGDFVERGSLPMDPADKGDVARKLRDNGIPLSVLVDEGVLSMFQVSLVRNARLILAQEGNAYTHNDVRGLWYVGSPGTGKSRAVRDRFGDSLYMKSQNKWFDGYTGEKTICIDDFDEGGKCLGHHLKIWADRYGCNGEVKGSTVALKHERFLITSNYTIDELFPEPILAAAIKRRFEVVEFN